MCRSAFVRGAGVLEEKDEDEDQQNEHEECSDCDRRDEPRIVVRWLRSRHRRFVRSMTVRLARRGPVSASRLSSRRRLRRLRRLRRRRRFDWLHMAFILDDGRIQDVQILDRELTVLVDVRTDLNLKP